MEKLFEEIYRESQYKNAFGNTKSVLDTLPDYKKGDGKIIKRKFFDWSESEEAEIWVLTQFEKGLKVFNDGKNDYGDMYVLFLVK